MLKNLWKRIAQKNTLLAITPGICTFILQFLPSFGGLWTPQNITSLVMFGQVIYFTVADGNKPKKESGETA